jgi:hypothetical protein
MENLFILTKPDQIGMYIFFNAFIKWLEEHALIYEEPKYIHIIFFLC